MNSDVFLVLTVSLSLLTLGVAILYYRRMRRVREEYEAAKGVVGDIVISFNKQVKAQEERLTDVAQKTYVLYSKSDEVERKMKSGEQQLSELATKVEAASKREQAVSLRVDESEKKMEELRAAQKDVLKKIEVLDKVERELSAVPEAKIEAVIPIKRERALAPLTETELTVLETLAAEGEKTAPEINKKLGLSREHMSRLMKKLYVNGYLERNTQKIPYSYHIKEEMLRILKKKAKSEA